jgi:hypothetical protein
MDVFAYTTSLQADGIASQSLVADFLSQAEDDTHEDIMKAVALTGYLGKDLPQYTNSSFHTGTTS